MSWPSVRAEFVDFSISCEGDMPVLYSDIKGIPTAAIGNAFESVEDMLAWPWVHVGGSMDGAPALPGAVRAEYQAVVALGAQFLAQAKELGVEAAKVFPPNSYWINRATIKLLPATINTLVLSKFDQFEAILTKNFFPAFGAWPADAQLATMSMAWALGPWFPQKWPLFHSDVLLRNWADAAAQSHIPDITNPGLVRRNAANLLMFQNAAAASEQGLAAQILFYPKTVTLSGAAA